MRYFYRTLLNIAGSMESREKTWLCMRGSSSADWVMIIGDADVVVTGVVSAGVKAERAEH